ncbi:hypothetical protein XENOCAPTIV_002103 [Xenoophorus captivus]|uniref:Uncharacterized protein n=1 Tax=Xenoophorus captivus TaxID=1517983 RepID=A0ABV0QKG1_9TELE
MVSKSKEMATKSLKEKGKMKEQFKPALLVKCIAVVVLVDHHPENQFGFSLDYELSKISKAIHVLTMRSKSICLPQSHSYFKWKYSLLLLMFVLLYYMLLWSNQVLSCLIFGRTQMQAEPEGER